MRLKGLESFKLWNGQTKLDASVSSHDGRMRLWKDGQEDSPLDSKGPYWMIANQVPGTLSVIFLAAFNQASDLRGESSP